MGIHFYSAPHRLYVQNKIITSLTVRLYLCKGCMIFFPKYALYNKPEAQ